MKNQTERFIITNRRFLKRATTAELQSYIYLRQQGLGDVLPDFRIENGWLSLEKCESIYPYFSLTDECFRWLYLSTVGKFHAHTFADYSPGVYKYMSPTQENYMPKPAHISTEPYFTQICNFIDHVELQFKLDVLDPSICSLKRYITSILDEWKDWKPIDGFSLLHGDWKISNMVYRQQPLLVDLEHMRVGIPEIEVSNFIVQLFGMRVESDRLVIPFLEEFFSCSSIHSLNYDIIRNLTTPILLYLRYVYALAGRILFKEDVLSAYPLAWKQYESMLL